MSPTQSVSRRYIRAQIIRPKGDEDRTALSARPKCIYISGFSSADRIISVACKLGGSYNLGSAAYHYIDLEKAELKRYELF